MKTERESTTQKHPIHGTPYPYWKQISSKRRSKGEEHHVKHEDEIDESH